jgi:RNA polymerase sigma factor (sigma-70 family)
MRMSHGSNGKGRSAHVPVECPRSGVDMTALMPERDAGPGDSRCERVWQHRPAMLRLARRRCRSLHDAEDVVGQAVLAAIRSHVPEDDLGPWLSRVVINLCMQSQRGHYRDLRLLDRAARRAELIDDGMEDRVVERLAAVKIASAANRLPERQRVVLELRSDGHSVNEIATQLGLPYKTVESLLSRARAALRGAAKTLLAGLTALSLLRRSWARTSVTVLAPAALAGLAVGVAPWGATGSASAARPVTAVSAVSAPPEALRHGAARPAETAAVHRASLKPTRRHARRAQPVGPTLRPHAGPVSAQLGGTERQHTEENLLQSVQRCVREHPQVTSAHVGCRD